jgi:hypothetical protein
MATKSKRRSVMEALLGDKKKQELEDQFEQLALKLDEAGINRKEFVVRRFKGLLEDLQPQIIAILDPLTDDDALKTEAANQTLAVIMGSFASAPEEEAPEEALDEVAEEIMQEEPPAEEDEEDEEVVMAEMRDTVLALARESTAVNKGITEHLIPAIIDIAKITKQLAPLAQQMDGLKGLDTRIKELEGIVKLRPRAASNAAATIVAEDEQTTKLKAAIQSGIEGDQTMLGVRVRPGSYKS